MKKMDGRDVKLNDLHFDMPRSQKNNTIVQSFCSYKMVRPVVS